MTHMTICSVCKNILLVLSVSLNVNVFPGDTRNSRRSPSPVTVGGSGPTPLRDPNDNRHVVSFLSYTARSRTRVTLITTVT